MICEILSVGTELLLGDVVDTNTAFLSRQMREMGINVFHHHTVGDNPERIKEQFLLSLSRADLVVVTGGLGPTYDDITREMAAEVFQAPLRLEPEVERDIREFFCRIGREMTENNLRQAMVPEGAKVLKNFWGTAPGLWLSKEGKDMILLPGVPGEMKELFSYHVKPVLLSSRKKCFAQSVLHFYGISESEVDLRLSDLMNEFSELSVAPYAGNGEVEIHLTAFSETKEKAEEKCEKAKEEILSRIGEYFYAEGESSLEEALVLAFAKEGKTLAVAESCTGGLVSQRITSVSGASRVMELCITSYSEEIKQKVLGVKEETLKTDGVYSRACALEMARGIRKLAKSDLGIGITGIAGPDGGTEENPVGTVFIALSSAEKEVAQRFVFGHKNPSRETVRNRAASKALSLALHHF